MEISGGITASLAGRYAAALYELASDQGAVAVVEADLQTLSTAIGESADLGELLRNPQITRDAAASAIDGVANYLGLAQLTRNFLGVLGGNRRLAALPDAIDAFVAIAAAQRGEVTADVTSAHPLDDGQIAQLAEKLAQSEGRTIKIRTSVDPEILGGLIVKIGSRQIDSSIRTRLNSLAQVLKG